jgi:hypothetical protein
MESPPLVELRLYETDPSYRTGRPRELIRLFLSKLDNHRSFLQLFQHPKRIYWIRKRLRYDYLKQRRNSIILGCEEPSFTMPCSTKNWSKCEKWLCERSEEQLRKQRIAFQIGSATRLDTLKAHVSLNTDRADIHQ